MTTAEWRLDVRNFTTARVTIKNEAGRPGLWRTMHALDGATRVIGYEQADIIMGKQAWMGDGRKPFRQRRKA